MRRIFLFLVPLFCLITSSLFAQSDNHLKLEDVFEFELSADPQISPDGSSVVYVRTSMDIMKDRSNPKLWVINTDGSDHRPLTDGGGGESSPRWSPDGSRLAYVASDDDGRSIFVRWMDTGQTAKLAQLPASPGNITWSPDGRRIAFSMFVEEKSSSFVQMPAKPEGAEWAKPAKVIDDLLYRADGQGYLKDGYRHLFVLPAEGGTPRQVTSGPYDHGGAISWSPAGDALYFSANRREDADLDPRNSEIYRARLSDGQISQLTDRQGPDGNPKLSPDGEQIAYLGFDDRYQGYQVTRLYVMDSDGTDRRIVTEGLDRDVNDPVWSADGNGVFFRYDDEGNTKIAYTSLSGDVEVLAEDAGGLSLGRPYSGSAYSVAKNGDFVFTTSRPDYPAELALGRKGSDRIMRLTNINDDLLEHRKLGEVEEIWYTSSFDGRRIHGWIVKPPDFDASKKYPLILEIHGGPFSNYGDRFSAEVQLFAANGYVVLYTNPRGSTSYGETFGNLIHHNYPGEDYDDLISGVDAVIEKGYIDENNLFVTGGSGGGVLTSWIIGKTDRFKAAVVAKPVINWYSFVLTADNAGFFYKYWFPGYPWEHEAHYMNRSPLSLVGNVTTPTMLLTGEADHRTPISETEQYYTALKLQGVESVMVRIPDAPHGIAGRPSNLIAKVAHILKWFEMHQEESSDVNME